MSFIKKSLIISITGLLMITGCVADESVAVEPVSDQNTSNKVSETAAVESTDNEEKMKQAALIGRTVPVLVPFEVKKEDSYKCGFKDEDGKVAVKPVYEFCGDMIEGMAYVALSKSGSEDEFLVGYVDYTGTVVIPVKNKIEHSWSLDFRDFSGGLVAMKKGDTWGYMDKKGNMVVPYTFSTAGNFTDGLAPVSTNEYKYGVIDLSGKKIVDFKYGHIEDFKDGMAIVKDYDSEKYGFITADGEQTVGFEWDAILGFSEGLSAVAVGVGDEAKWGFIDETGKVIIKPKYDYAFIDMGGDSTEVLGGYYKDGVVDVYNHTDDGKFTAITIDKKGKRLKSKAYDTMMDVMVN